MTVVPALSLDFRKLPRKVDVDVDVRNESELHDFTISRTGSGVGFTVKKPLIFNSGEANLYVPYFLYYLSIGGGISGKLPLKISQDTNNGGSGFYAEWNTMYTALASIHLKFSNYRPTPQLLSNFTHIRDISNLELTLNSFGYFGKALSKITESEFWYYNTTNNLNSYVFSIPVAANIYEPTYFYYLTIPIDSSSLAIRYITIVNSPNFISGGTNTPPVERSQNGLLFSQDIKDYMVSFGGPNNYFYVDISYSGSLDLSIQNEKTQEEGYALRTNSVQKVFSANKILDYWNPVLEQDGYKFTIDTDRVVW
jgi:hypothetical protein